MQCVQTLSVQSPNVRVGLITFNHEVRRSVHVCRYSFELLFVVSPNTTNVLVSVSRWPSLFLNLCC